MWYQTKVIFLSLHRKWGRGVVVVIFFSSEKRFKWLITITSQSMS